MAQAAGEVIDVCLSTAGLPLGGSPVSHVFNSDQQLSTLSGKRMSDKYAVLRNDQA